MSEGSTSVSSLVLTRNVETYDLSPRQHGQIISSTCTNRECLSLFGNGVVSAHKSLANFVPSVAPGKALNKYQLQDLVFISYIDFIDSEIQYIT